MVLARDKLLDSQCKAAKSGELYDGGGLILRVHSENSKNWVYRYQMNGRRTTMGLGSYPAVCLAQARCSHRGYGASVKLGNDPLVERTERARMSATV